MNTLLFEPHFDDAAYSLSGLILSGVIDPMEAELVTVFTQSTFAPYANVKTIDEISALRAIESASFCQQLKLKNSTLGFSEAPIRGYSLDAIFDENYKSNLEQNLKDNLLKEMGRLKKQFQPSRIFCPLGISGHIDHFIVRECAEETFENQLFYYEDLPYAGEISSAEYQAWIDALTIDLIPLKNEWNSFLKERIRLLKTYQSQVADKDIQAVINYTERNVFERYWMRKQI